MVGEEKRHQMMQNLFGDQSEEDEEEEEEEEVESEHESNRQPDYASDEADIGQKAEGEVVVEGQGEADIGSDSDGELNEMEPEHIESEGERDQSSQEVDLVEQRDESEEKDSGSDQLGQPVVTSRRREVVESESERSEENHYMDNADEEIDQAISPRSPNEEKDEAHISETAPEIRDVFGESDDEEPAEYEAVQNNFNDDANRSPMEEDEGYEKDLRPEDMLADEEGRYDSEEDNKYRAKEKPVGPPLELGIPLRPPPSDPEKMNMIKVSNIMGIDPKPFDPKTFREEDANAFVADESGHKRIRLDNNIVRYRAVRNPDGTTSYESNARFVRWSDGSLQLQIGNEVLDISVQDAQHDQAHLFLRHEKGILQSQGRVLKKMRFMPSSLTSNSHRLLTAIVDSRHKKVFRVKKTVTDIDPEREKEQKEKAENQSIRAQELLSKKKEKVSRKYAPTVRRERQLSPGFLEDGPEEDDEQDYYDSRSSAARRRREEDFENEARAEKRIINAKKSQGHKDTPRKSSLHNMKSSRRPVDDYESEREESEYETEPEEDERSPPRRRAPDPDRFFDEEEDEDQYEEDLVDVVSDEETELKHKASGGSLKRQEIESDGESPPRKAATSHRRKAFVYESDEE